VPLVELDGSSGPQPLVGDPASSVSPSPFTSNVRHLARRTFDMSAPALCMFGREVRDLRDARAIVLDVTKLRRVE
jgi:hypothetical protein